MKWVLYLKDSSASRNYFWRTLFLPSPTIQHYPPGPLALGLAFHLSNLSSEQVQSGINIHVTGNTCCFDTSGYDKKKSITQQLSPLLLSNSVSKSHRMEDGGLRKAGRKCGGDTLWNSNLEQHVWLTYISPLGPEDCPGRHTHKKKKQDMIKMGYITSTHIHKYMTTSNFCRSLLFMYLFRSCAHSFPYLAYFRWNLKVSGVPYFLKSKL